MLWLIAFVLVLVIYAWARHLKRLRPLSKIPKAHFLAPYTRLWMDWIRFTGQEFEIIHQAFERYGPYIRLGPQEVAVNDIDAVTQHIYGIGDGNLDKTVNYCRFEHHGKRNAFTSLGHDHIMRRKRVARIYSKQFLQNSSIVQGIIRLVIEDSLMPVLHKAATQNTSFDAVYYCIASGIDITSATIYGACRGTDFILDEQATHRWLDAYRGSHNDATAGFWLGQHPHLVSVLRYVGLDPVPRNYYKMRQRLEDWAVERAISCDKFADTLEPPEASESIDYPLVFSTLKSSICETSEKMTQLTPNSSEMQEIASECMDHLIATRDTLAPSASCILWQLSRNQEAQSNLRREIHSTMAHQSYLETEKRHGLTTFDLEKLPYMHAVIMESIRLRTTEPTFNPRSTSNVQQNSRIGPYRDVPGGTTFGAFAYCLHHEEEYFPRATEFIPERWLNFESDGTITKKETLQGFWGFGSGSRACLGRHMAFEIIRRLLVSIYTEYRTTIANEAGFGERTKMRFLTGGEEERLLLNIEKLQA